MFLVCDAPQMTVNFLQISMTEVNATHLPVIRMQGWSQLSGQKSQGPHLADGVTLGALL